MTNSECRMTKEVQNLDDELLDEQVWGMTETTSALALHEGTASSERVYDLEERTARFGEAVIRFAKKIPRSPVNDRLINQVVGAATSVGANYCEADDGVSLKDFRHCIGTCRKEARETKHFLRMIATAEETLKPEARVLWQEARELHLIFCAIWRKSS
jgi:four helix bundle protein